MNPELIKNQAAAGVVRIEQNLITQAYEKLRKGEYEDASAEFAEILKKFNIAMDEAQKSILHTELANTYLWLGNYESAKRHANKALGFSKDNTQATVVLGRVAICQYDFREARSQFLRLPEDNGQRFLGLTLVAIKLRDVTAASAYFVEARKRCDGSDPELKVIYAYLLVLSGDTKYAISQARPLVAECEDEPFLLIQLGEVFMTAGHYGDATAVAEKVQKRCPQNDQALALRAFAAYAEEDFTTAENFARDAVRFNPRNAYAKTVLMKLALRNGNDLIAEELGVGILKDSPDYSLAHANLGDVYFNQGRYELAGIEYEQTMELMNSNTKGARLRQARMKFIGKDYGAAEELLEKLIQTHHTYYDDAMCDLLLCYEQLGATKKKEELMEKMELRKSFYHRTERLLKKLQ